MALPVVALARQWPDVAVAAGVGGDGVGDAVAGDAGGDCCRDSGR